MPPYCYRLDSWFTKRPKSYFYNWLKLIFDSEERSDARHGGNNVSEYIRASFYSNKYRKKYFEEPNQRPDGPIIYPREYKNISRSLSQEHLINGNKMAPFVMFRIKNCTLPKKGKEGEYDPPEDPNPTEKPKYDPKSGIPPLEWPFKLELTEV